MPTAPNRGAVPSRDSAPVIENSMSNSNSSNLKRRPVDLLFGETGESTFSSARSPSARTSILEQREARERGEAIPTPSYMIEPPRPPTILRPPPPEFPPDWRLGSPGQPVGLEHAPEIVKGAGTGAKPQAALRLTPARAASARLAMRIKPTRAQWRAEAPSAAANRSPVSDECESLASLIDTLYLQVSEEASDSPRLSEYCLSLLRDARSLLKREDYAQAEYKAQQVKDRMLRARASAEAARSSALKLIWTWEIVVGLGAVVVTLLPFYITLVAGVVPLLRAVALGALGGIMVSLWNLTQYLHNREYDPAYNPDYWASPLKGALIGGVIYFLSVLGLVAAPGALGVSRLFGSLSGANLLMYFIALLAGIAQDHVFDFVRGGMAAVFRSPARAPSLLSKGGAG
jgi:hypothetical protein